MNETLKKAVIIGGMLTFGTATVVTQKLLFSMSGEGTFLFSCSHSHTLLTRSHTRSHTLYFTLYFTLSLTLSLTFALTFALTLSFTLSFTFVLTVVVHRTR